ncbi:MAG: tRNA dimethylallyltransferase [Candidatus Saccharibacteria bacterium]|nr:tRNA dimethylallyltransferase [Candidatus Saccharibacteria bacterium]
MEEVEPNFRARVEALVRQIPKGRVMTYGQLAALCGNARAARIVGGIAHFGDPDLPWQRVVNKQGGLASGYPGGRSGHKQVLEQEGFEVSDEYTIDVQKLIWWPEGHQPDEQPNPQQSKISPPLIVVVGETASGKSSLALQLAQQYNGEIICADSSTVRREANIGTAKPTPEEQQMVPHHLLDITGPDEEFSAAMFKEQANKAIADIASRGKLPIMVGGTGLYINGVIYDYGFLPPVSGSDRQELNQMSNSELLQRIADLGLSPNGIDTQNNRRLIRFVETGGAQPTKQELRANTLVLGLKTDKAVLLQRITQRVDAMLEQGLEKEVDGLAKTYGWDCEALKAVGYSQWKDYFLGEQSLAETRQLIIKATKDLAKRQRTWFKRNKSIQWLTTPVNQADFVDSITTLLED